MRFRKLVATCTAMALTCATLSAPPQALGADQPSRPTGPRYITITIADNTSPKLCRFSANTDIAENPLAGAFNQWDTFLNFRNTLREKIRGHFPQLQDSFAALDKLAREGGATADNATYSTEYDTVANAMTAAGYNEAEVYLALQGTDQWKEVNDLFSQQSLTLLPDMDRKRAAAWLRQPSDAADSIDQAAADFIRSAGKLRQWNYDLYHNASLALLGDLPAGDPIETNTKEATALLPHKLVAVTRQAVSGCDELMRKKDLLDGTLSSDTSSDPFAGMSSDNSKGNLFTGSTELSSGEGTSSRQDLAELSSTDGFDPFSSNNSDEANRKIGLLIALVTMLALVTNMLVQATPIVQQLNEKLEAAIAERNTADQAAPAANA
ncbi:hypothetical protein ACFPVT_06690 [Corynebacterium choanae]|uniref:Secreted protein n=1 Tax=Corynebacterium choanae TaxID=1862358 RepID=A0A3G6J7B2_9CORY|nr:hypothetical protein [Corynebacterium choanae]AZA13769.1 hypothetical protein CCHOA_06885 [Corynebacterium choanae]